MNKTRVTLDDEVVDLIDDALAYFRLSEMGGGDRDTAEDRATMERARSIFERARARCAR
jgi:hypothetical protein